MKKNIFYAFILPIFAAFTACSEGADRENSPYTDGFGGLNLKNQASTEIVIPVITKSADFSEISAADFYIAIKDANGAVAKEFTSYSAMVDAGFPLILPVGSYTVVASSYKLGDTKVSTVPYFVDEQSFEIEEKTTTNVRLVCKYESLGVELALSEQFKAKLEADPNNYDYKVVVSNGEAEYTFTKENMKPGYFLSGCDELVVAVSVRLGSGNLWYPTRTYRVKNDTGSELTSPCTGEYYVIRLDVGETPEETALKFCLLTEKEQ